MRNKNIVFFIVVVLFLGICVPRLANAERQTHITVYTDKGDSTFHFDILTYLIGAWFSSGSSFDMTTTDLSGTHSITSIRDNPPEYVPGYYRIIETPSDDYEISSINCYCDNSYYPHNVFFYQDNEVYISPQNDSSPNCALNFYCDFYNTRIKYPILVVPGIGGTEMNGESGLLWPDITRMFLSPSDGFLDPLAFSQNIIPSDSSVYKSDVIKTGELFGATVYDYTDRLIQEFEGQGYVEGETLFAFPYDWRYGVSGEYADGKTNSDLLGEKIQQILAQTGASRVDVVAHSMGGLIVKKYVADNQASHEIGKAIFVGVPNTGAPDAVKALVQGDNFGISFGPVGLNDAEMKKLAENMPGVYDLLPSQKYYDTAGSFVRVVTEDIPNSDFSQKDLNYQEVGSYLLQDKELNQLAYSNGNLLHTQTFDDFDLRGAGVDLYAIDGCKTATMTGLTEIRHTNIFGYKVVDYRGVELKTGDGTVPIQSSTNLPIDQSKKYYVLTGEHSKLLSQNGSRQEIVNLLSGSNLSIGSNLITQDVGQCQLNGKVIEVFSPLDISAIDQLGNEMKLVDGNITNSIPNANFEILGNHKFIYLPDDLGQEYVINMQGTGDGTYTIKAKDILNNQIVKEEIFSDLPVTPELTGQINLPVTSGGQTTLLVDGQTIAPTQTIDYSTDTVAPEATIKFDPVAKDLVFLGTDNLSDISSISIKDNGSTTILTDQAGNTTELQFKESGRRTAMSAQLVSLKYNGVPAVLASNSMNYSWSLDKSGNLAKLTQKVKSRGDYSITAVFDGTNTKITGTTSAGKFAQSFAGLKILKVATSGGDLSWSY